MEEEKNKTNESVKASEAEKVEKAEKVEDTEKTEKGCGSNKAAICLASVALVAAVTSSVFSVLSYQKSSTPLTFLSSGSDGNSANFTEGSIADVVNRLSSSVVSILTSVKSTSYFGRSVESQAAGTGVIVTEDGYVLTNKHVIEGASSISVVLDDGTTYKDVKVAAVDSLNDVAFLKINDVSGLKPATLGDSKTITVGQQVVAIGNALGQYQNSVTSGVVSGTGRSLTATDSTGTMSENLSDMIQTDAAINSGNSGGPLINAAGEVIGINTATSSSAENMGFAIPIAAVKGMLSQLKDKGSAERAYLGVYTVEITADTAKTYNLPVSAGAYLYASGGTYSAIVADSPASKAGLKDKDIITAVNGAKIGAAGSLSTLIGEYKPGDTVQLAVIRDGKEIAINVTLEGYKEK
ncbi:trypsin-like peptidase domain-containing protein [Candidatus Saccharibacteria bacterium]|nr:trypsin-like peptidase domain-containing protein [Candidatus Saccharibacteria bacterium]